MKEYQLFVDGQYRPATSGKFDDSLNPATGELFARVQRASLEDALAAVESAHQAFASWGKVSPKQREAILLRAADLVQARAEELRDLLIDEGGAITLKANFEVHETADFLRGIAGECRRIRGETYESNYPGVKSFSIRRPLGVVLSIAPFNFPLLLAVRKIGWALAAGNTVVLKPSEATPVIGLRLAEILLEAGLPKGVLNVITGNGADIGDDLIADPRIRYVSFTGSSNVGRHIATQAARHMKKCALELGGKNPVVVLADAELDYAVNVAVFSNFIHQGQICMAGSKLIVEAPLYDAFCDKFAARVAQLKVGLPRDPGTIIGPLIRAGQAPFIQTQVDNACAEGARLLTGGRYEGSFYQPTVLADVTPQMSIFRTECFGPVAAVIHAQDHEHALALANDNDYGLSAALLTKDLEKAMLLAEGLEAGMVHINGPSVRDEPVIPFGGVKDSGFSREGGQFAIAELTELKWITVQTGHQHFPF